MLMVATLMASLAAWSLSIAAQVSAVLKFHRLLPSLSLILRCVAAGKAQGVLEADETLRQKEEATVESQDQANAGSDSAAGRHASQACAPSATSIC